LTVCYLVTAANLLFYYCCLQNKTGYLETASQGANIARYARLNFTSKEIHHYIFGRSGALYEETLNKMLLKFNYDSVDPNTRTKFLTTIPLDTYLSVLGIYENVQGVLQNT
jgi:hypothetical protein